MIHVIAVLALLALGFGAGRVKHPSNLKLANVKAEIAKIEAEAKASAVVVDALAAVDRIKSLL